MSDSKDIHCSECDREECIFDKFCKNFIETASWRVERELIESRLEAGNLRQRTLQKTLLSPLRGSMASLATERNIQHVSYEGLENYFRAHFTWGLSGPGMTLTIVPLILMAAKSKK